MTNNLNIIKATNSRALLMKISSIDTRNHNISTKRRGEWEQEGILDQIPFIARRLNSHIKERTGSTIQKDIPNNIRLHRKG